ncbi:Aste57867_17296 [Aphanomyces stellatus]|uniref:Aste57867_17296 protein n=1 Tax=Aphanomyces stellatus TaxID=120398 RepID=A0A485L7F2_9STRA|nr:hypothetical protein As57867_017237 [Aphanomyces stellatus]KAF0713642.1 hypothetical protein As57867_004253 [Aphanomyces stellatus]VFT81379.1 Aste57867_4264 [Aphanomyces stellatus]VFT94052.1 Aste57867_17296 [Aphanomyces stellatus]
MKPCFFLGCCLMLAVTAANDTLRQVFILSRHGVRGPYGPDGLAPTEAALQRYSKNKYPFPVTGTEWGTSDDATELVSPKITKHGALVIQRMGEYFSKHLYPSIAESKCSDAMAYADRNERDYVTAQEFLRGFLPSCAALTPVTNGTRLLFEQGQDPTATCPTASEAVYSGIVGGDDASNVARLYKPQVQALNDLLDCCEPVVCGQNDTDTSGCDLFDVPSQWNGAFYDPWHDSLSESQFLSEWFLLQSLNNMSLPGSLNLDDVVQLGAIHKAHMDLVTNQFNAENFGSTLLVHIVASMQQTIQQTPVSLASGDGPQLLQTLSNRFLFYAGHDINLLFLKNLLRLEWVTPNWLSNQPNPGSMLVFELHGYKNTSTLESDFYVQAYFVAASPLQIRTAATLTLDNPPDRVPVSIPHCSHDVLLADGSSAVRCNFTDFKKAAGHAIRQVCVSPTLAKYATSLLLPVPAASWGFKVVVVAVLSIALLTVMWKYITLLNTPKHGADKYAKYTPLT